MNIIRRGFPVLFVLSALCGPLSAGETFPDVPSPRCIAREMKRGSDEAAATTVCRARKKRQNRIHVKPRDEPVEMTAGAPPLFIDDTGTPGPQNWEFNFIVAGSLSRDSDGYLLPALDLNYGIGERIQLMLAVPYVLDRTVQTDAAGNRAVITARGVSDSAAGVKYRFYDDEESGLSLALYPQVEFRTPGTRLEADGGVATRGTTFSLPLLLVREFDYFSLTANAGFEKSSEEPRAEYFATFGAGTRLTEKLALLGELAGRGLGRGDERRILFNVGLKRKLSEKHALVLSVGRDLVAGADGQKHCYFLLAYQRLFEQKK